MAKYSQEIIERKLAWLSPHCPLGDFATQSRAEAAEEIPKANVAGAR
jgi:hypothetical protein